MYRIHVRLAAIATMLPAKLKRYADAKNDCMKSIFATKCLPTTEKLPRKWGKANIELSLFESPFFPSETRMDLFMFRVVSLLH